jgi:hypothetical protein
MKYRFIGGPLHGTLRAARDQFLAVPVREPYRLMDFNKAYCFGPDDFAPYREAIYERHLLALGTNTRVYVYRLRDMGDDEFMRRVADLIEGVGESSNR